MTLEEFGKESEKIRPYLLEYAIKLCANKADDLVQDAFVNAIKGLDGFDGNNFKSWMVTIMRHKFLDDVRREKKKICPIDWASGAFADDLNGLDLLVTDEIKGLLSHLTNSQRKAMQLRMDGYSYNEIAEIMKIDRSQVGPIIFRARFKLKQLIE